MGAWTEEEFQRVAVSTKLSRRTLAACRDVLVDGLSGTDASARHDVLPPQTSRGLKVLRDRQSEILESLEVSKDSSVVLKSNAVKRARAIAGEDLAIEEAVCGRQYEGPGIVKNAGFLVQQVEIAGVIHDLGRLQQSPNIGARLEIAYPEDGGLASVIEKLPEKAQGKDRGGVGR